MTCDEEYRDAPAVGIRLPYDVHMSAWVPIVMSALAITISLGAIGETMHSERLKKGAYLTMARTCRLKAEMAELQGRHEDIAGHLAAAADLEHRARPRRREM